LMKMVEQRGAVAVVLLASSSFCVSAFSPASGFAAVLSRSRGVPAQGLAGRVERATACGVRGVREVSMQETKLGKKSSAKEVLDFFKTDLRGKTAVITGANSGIGLVKRLKSLPA
jgi:hypothetical protein